MDHDTPAPIRVGHFPLAGDQVTRGGRNYYVVTVDRRQEWWWQSGPVAWCCICFTLEVGIVIMAGLKVAANLLVLLMVKSATSNTNSAEQHLAMEQAKYENDCTGDSPTMAEHGCQLLKRDIDLRQNFLSSENHEPGIAYVLVYIGVLVGLAGGVAGLLAGSGRNTMAAKLFYWSMLAGLWLSVASFVVSLAKGHLSSYGTPVTLVFNAVYYFFFVYFTKVAWSYYAVLKARGISTSSGFDDGVELRDIYGDERSDETA